MHWVRYGGDPMVVAKWLAFRIDSAGWTIYDKQFSDTIKGLIMHAICTDNPMPYFDQELCRKIVDSYGGDSQVKQSFEKPIELPAQFGHILVTRWIDWQFKQVMKKADTIPFFMAGSLYPVDWGKMDTLVSGLGAVRLEWSKYARSQSYRMATEYRDDDYARDLLRGDRSAATAAVMPSGIETALR
jgi:hypothetical protein